MQAVAQVKGPQPHAVSLFQIFVLSDSNEISHKLESVSDGVWNMPNETCNSGI